MTFMKQSNVSQICQFCEGVEERYVNLVNVTT